VRWRDPEGTPSSAAVVSPAPTPPPIDEVAARGFGAAAQAYENARPGYPAEALALLAGELGVAPGARVCDLGAGTGKLTRALVELGAEVVACEPVDAMRALLAKALPTVRALDGTAEHIPLPDASVDVVTVAQAFHWFDAPAALAEIARVLRRGGALVLLWNERDESTPWVAEMSRLIRWHERTVSRYQHVDWAAVVAASGAFTPLEEQSSRWDQPLTRDMLADRVRSISYIAAMPVPERERLAREVVSLVARRPEPFPLPYICRVQWARSIAT
jgi:SAM-dependent methyltransferase